MGAALTVAVLLALSVSIVRVAAVAMRLTGLPENIARFQCVSALTGTGFTTNEAEMIVNYPVRRRIVVTLMVLGNLGLVSIAATFIVAFVNTGPDPQHIAIQAGVMAAAITLTFVVSTNRRLDRAMCGMIGRMLSRSKTLRDLGYHRLLQLGADSSVAEHVYQGPQAIKVSALDLHGLTPLAMRPAGSLETRTFEDDTTVAPGDTLVLSGDEAGHRAFGSESR